MTLRVASLCSGVGGLDLAVESVLDAELAWYAQYEPPDKNGKEDKNQYAAQIMAARFPGVPNLGDITAIDYTQVEPVDILTAGFPCTDLSLAGKRAGLMPGTRSGIWSHVARAVEVLRPSLVFIENVRSLTSAKAHSDLEHCPWCMGEAAEGGGIRSSASASTRSCSRRSGRPRVRCGVAGASRLRHRSTP
jgi:DNA (cytosine-5)-methyltransferase 1